MTSYTRLIRVSKMEIKLLNPWASPISWRSDKTKLLEWEGKQIFGPSWKGENSSMWTLRSNHGSSHEPFAPWLPFALCQQKRTARESRIFILSIWFALGINLSFVIMWSVSFLYSPFYFFLFRQSVAGGRE